MKKIYDKVEIEVSPFAIEDVICTSFEGEVDGDETQYPTPPNWVQ